MIGEWGVFIPDAATAVAGVSLCSVVTNLVCFEMGFPLILLLISSQNLQYQESITYKLALNEH